MANFFDSLPTPTKRRTAGGPSPGGYHIYSRKVIDYDTLNENRQNAISTAAGGLKTSVADILGLRSTAEEQADLAKAQGIEAEGAQKESDLYLQNAALEKASGDIQLYQDRRDLSLSMGKTIAQLAGGNLATSGSGMDLLSSSVRQGAIQQQLTMTQTAINQGGYLTSAAAADTRRDSALALQSNYEGASIESRASADAQAKDLLGFMKDMPGLGGTREGLYTIKTLRAEGYDKFKNVSKTPYSPLIPTIRERQGGLEGLVAGSQAAGLSEVR